MLVWFKAPELVEPEVGSDPLQAPLALQELALVLFQVKVLAAPADTVVGEALSVTVGVGGGVAGP